ncbi:Utp14-domain-containing protein [Neolentinus lepideus HHB14362 ss-1]|uniref:Utp14-domain-containing protein n=1 Tax=Neolentinus lepideus HHB14362 ss-1 TaxID=1314782 RepID=A0A165U443_9AGAM|nr:Utp14-domain-containing protein [Neolentinus lepideus HHB14362 ss-1]
MARANKKAGSSKVVPATRKANAAGYAKRQSSKGKAKAFAGGISDVYEYEQGRTRRSKVPLKLDRYEATEFGVNEDGEDGNDDLGGSRSSVSEWTKRPRLVGENDDEGFDPEDDEEIDSDEAFEESDEERFAGLTFASDAKSKKGTPGAQLSTRSRGVRFADVDLNEDDDDSGKIDTPEPVEGNLGADAEEDETEEEEEDGEADEFIDVLDVLDGRGDPDIVSGDEGSVEHETGDDGVTVRPQGRDESEAEVDEGEEEESQGNEKESSVLLEEDAADLNPEALDKLENFISNLSASQKRKADDASRDDGERPRKRRFMKERTTVGAEGEFNATTDQNKLQLDDLLSPLVSQSSALLSLKKAAKPLMSASKGALDAPLPTRTQERLDREAAYEQTKEEVDKWKATMKRIKEAEHLSFPLQAPSTSRTSNLELTAKFKPTTELETSVDRLLKSAKMREEDLQRTEDLMMNDLSVEEVAARRAELRKMRDLVFRADAKAKRIAKIKSKTFRKIKKKEREKLMAQLDENDDDDGEEARMKREVERARERATLKHKNTGKWAKTLKARHELDVDQRREITEMLERGEALRKKIRGEGQSDEEDSDESDGDVDRFKASAFEEIEALKGDDLPDVSGKHQSIFNMKFMRDAAAREQQRVDEEADDFIRDLGGNPTANDDEEPNETAELGPPGIIVQRTSGRVQYQPGALLTLYVLHSDRTTLKPANSLASDTSSVTLRSTDRSLDAPATEKSIAGDPSSSISTSGQADNPWLVAQDSAMKGPRRKNVIVVAKGSSSIEKSKYKIRKGTSKQAEPKEKAQDDAVVEISMDDALTLTGADPSKKKSAPTRTSTQDEVAYDSDANSEVEEQEKAIERKATGTKGKQVKAFEQRDLVALAFAGDNVVQEFDAAKRKEIEEDAPHEIDTTLPGWGSWGGKGARKTVPKRHLIKKVTGIDPNARADYNKSHVIIAEKRDKKAAKYLVKDLPHPYTSQAQYERRMDMPLGTEWNTRLGFQRSTLPKVTKKMGTIIRPLEKLT